MTLIIDTLRGLKDPDYRYELSDELEGSVTELLFDAAAEEIEGLRLALSDAADALDLANELLSQKPVTYAIPLTNQFNARHAAAERARAALPSIGSNHRGGRIDEANGGAKACNLSTCIGTV